MTDNDLEQIQTVDVKITAESIDAHVICLRITKQDSPQMYNPRHYLQVSTRMSYVRSVKSRKSQSGY